MRKLLMLFSVLFLCTTLVQAQQRQISGKVTDKTGEPISGATIQVKGSNTGTSAASDGSFNISAKTGDDLVISAVNYGEITVKVGSGSSVGSVSLDAKESALTEVVVTALGVQRQRKDLGYATAKVSNAEVNKAAPINIANGLQGKVSGLNITSINNGVFADVKINLRGIRSLTGNNNPMLLLDGVPVGLGYLASLNPNDIQDVSILKGSSGAAVYGPDARNGVIIVTTKRGTRGNPIITLNHTTQLERISFFPKMQNQFGSGGGGEYIPYENWSWGPAFDGTLRPLGKPLPDGDQQMVTYSAKPNEKKKFFNTGLTIQNDVSFSAKDFYLSIQDANIKGIVPDDQNRRTGIRMNVSKEYGRFKAQVNTNYIQQNYDIFDNNQMSNYYTAQNVGLNDGLMNLIFSTPGQVPITSYKDFVNNKYATYNNYYNDYGINPYFALDNWRQKGKNDNLITNIDLSLKATNWLSLTYRAAATINNFNASSTSKGELINDFGRARSFTDVPGAVFESSTRSSRLSSEFFASANKTFNDFKVGIIAGTYFRQTDAEATNVSASNLVVPELFNVGNLIGNLGGSSSTSRTRMLSYYGTANINYKGWINLELTGRTDGVSVLGIGNNRFFYPGANASLVLSDAISSIKNSNLISYLKVRGGINKTGNADINPYQLQPTYSGASGGFPFGTLPGYTANNTAYDPNLKPEFVTNSEIGVELGLLKNRINIEAAYFNQDCTDQIIQINSSPATGYTGLFTNAASFVNRGFELDLRLTPLVNFRKGNIDLKLNGTYNTSEITSIYEGLDELQIGGFVFASNNAVVGSPAFIWSATDYLRDDQGRVIVDPVSGEPTQDPVNKKYGRTLPLWIVGINPSVNWNGLSLSVVGEYRGGHYAYHNIGPDMAWTGVSAQTGKNNRERFVFPNSSIPDPGRPGSYIPNTSVTVADPNNFYTTVFRDVATNFLTSAASWRIREVALSYDIPTKIFARQNIVKAVTITLNARNLFLWVPKANEFTDPDFNFTSGNTSGVNTSQINPPTRIFGANVNIRF